MFYLKWATAEKNKFIKKKKDACPWTDFIHPQKNAPMPWLSPALHTDSTEEEATTWEF